MHKRVELPRFVLVKTASGLTSRIPQSLLTPTSDEFDVEITEEHIVVTKKIQVQMETLSTANVHGEQSVLIDGERENEQLYDELGGLAIGEGGLGDGPEMSISQCDLTDQNANLQ